MIILTSTPAQSRRAPATSPSGPRPMPKTSPRAGRLPFSGSHPAASTSAPRIPPAPDCAPPAPPTRFTVSPRPRMAGANGARQLSATAIKSLSSRPLAPLSPYNGAPTLRTDGRDGYTSSSSADWEDCDSGDLEDDDDSPTAAVVIQTAVRTRIRVAAAQRAESPPAGCRMDDAQVAPASRLRGDSESEEVPPAPHGNNLMDDTVSPDASLAEPSCQRHVPRRLSTLSRSSSSSRGTRRSQRSRKGQRTRAPGVATSLAAPVPAVPRHDSISRPAPHGASLIASPTETSKKLFSMRRLFSRRD